jgi:phosphatidylserine/phosphatidylglycerophosphate/cardiolipin synthase-like enzyme
VAITDLSGLDRYKAGPTVGAKPGDPRTFFSPVDEVHKAIMAVLRSTSKSLVISMYGFDDQEYADLIKEKLQNPGVFVQLTLDSSQASGVHEKALLAEENYPASSVAVGRSERGAIIHLKLAIVDGFNVIDGSTNWSASGETLQDNQCTIHGDLAFANECRARVDAIHANILAKAASN